MIRDILTYVENIWIEQKNQPRTTLAKHFDLSEASIRNLTNTEKEHQQRMKEELYVKLVRGLYTIKNEFLKSKKNYWDFIVIEYRMLQIDSKAKELTSIDNLLVNYHKDHFNHDSEINLKTNTRILSFIDILYLGIESVIETLKQNNQEYSQILSIIIKWKNYHQHWEEELRRLKKILTKFDSETQKFNEEIKNIKINNIEIFDDWQIPTYKNWLAIDIEEIEYYLEISSYLLKFWEEFFDKSENLANHKRQQAFILKAQVGGTYHLPEMLKKHEISIEDIPSSNVDDLVVIPGNSEFYVGKITSDAYFDERKVRVRKIEWLVNAKPIPNYIAESDLLIRMKSNNRCTQASDLISKIKEYIYLAQANELKPNPQYNDISKYLDNLPKSSAEVEKLICQVLNSLGAIKIDKIADADLLCTFKSGVSVNRIAVEIKHWRHTRPISKEIVRKSMNSIETTQADQALIITTGLISQDAKDLAYSYFDEKGIIINFIDGELLIKLIVENEINIEEL